MLSAVNTEIWLISVRIYFCCYIETWLHLCLALWSIILSEIRRQSRGYKLKKLSRTQNLSFFPIFWWVQGHLMVQDSSQKHQLLQLSQTADEWKKRLLPLKESPQAPIQFSSHLFAKLSHRQHCIWETRNVDFILVSLVQPKSHDWNKYFPDIPVAKTSTGSQCWGPWARPLVKGS